MQTLEFTPQERDEILSLYSQVYEDIKDTLRPDDGKHIRRHITEAIGNSCIQRDIFGLNPVLLAFQTALLVTRETGLRRDAVIAILMRPCVDSGAVTLDDMQLLFGESVTRILHGLQRIQELYRKNPVIETENFRNLLLSFAEDMRVILIMIADRVNLMRQIRDTEQLEAKQKVCEETKYLYAPLAHKLGLYKLKSELEDLYLKYTEHDAYYHIKDKLNETKQNRDAYIDRFILPIEERLRDAGLKFHIKGRTKSIHSIWQKMMKQKCPFEGVYDLFAIRVILDAPADKEKIQCWQAFAIITSMYQPNPKRLRDWLSIPKSNGYESLHITVLGPEQKWVEVQIRTERMDDIAERGVAAHWRYKGIKSESGLDEWLTGVRKMLETSDGTEAMDQFRMDLYEDEVFVFTPKGDLYKLPKGATVLDFAYHIHSHLGNTCTGARINGRAVNIRQQLKSGDQVDIMTSSNQHPKQEWLSIVKTSRAKSKIRLAMKEAQSKDKIFAKEMLERKMNNRKLTLDDSTMQLLLHRLGIKEFNDFYHRIVSGELDAGHVVDLYGELQEGGASPAGSAASAAESASHFVLNESAIAPHLRDDVLVIGSDLKGIDYSLARCCQPIYGDDVFGFVTVSGGIKIHRTDCPNAPELQRRFPYRIVKARWSGKGGSQYAVTLRVVGNDNIGIINNLTSVISKDERLTLRSIKIDSHDGLFSGTVVIMVDDTSRMESLIKKLRTIKGIKQVERF